MFANSKSLEGIRIASPCTAAWNEMEGDDRFRFCRQCQKYVYNLSSMSRLEAEALVNSVEGRVCVRFYKRADGTVLTEDCPVGLRQKVIHWTLGSLAGAVAVLLALVGADATGSGKSKGRRSLVSALREIEPIGRVIEWIDPSPPPPAPERFVMGKVAAPRK
jgi:hypothetical protein